MGSARVTPLLRCLCGSLWCPISKGNQFVPKRFFISSELTQVMLSPALSLQATIMVTGVNKTIT